MDKSIGYRNGRLYNLKTGERVYYAALPDWTFLSEGPWHVEVKSTSVNGKPVRSEYDARYKTWGEVPHQLLELLEKKHADFIDFQQGK